MAPQSKAERLDWPEAEKLLALAEAAVDAVDCGLDSAKRAARGPLYAHGVRDTLWWLLRQPVGSPVTAGKLAEVLDRLAVPPTVVQIFMARLRQARKDLRLTQQQMASRLGVQPVALCRWENGRRVPAAEVLMAWAELLEEEVPQEVMLVLVQLLPQRGGRRAECGTISGRMAHRRRRETVCQSCRDSWTAYMTRYRARLRSEPADDEVCAG